MAEQASSAFGNASSISTRSEKIYFIEKTMFVIISCYTIYLNDYRRGNLEGNTRSRNSSRKDTRKSIYNQKEDSGLNSNIGTQYVIYIFYIKYI